MIVLDTPRPARFRRFRQTSHMCSTLTGPEAHAELVAFGQRIGLRLAWLQNAGTPTEHFDLFDGAIGRALAAGATQVSSRELVLQCVQPKRAALLETSCPST